jgi:hypothetical protein
MEERTRTTCCVKGADYGRGCQGTPAAVPMRASIRASALNKGGSGDPGMRSAVGRPARIQAVSGIYTRDHSRCYLLIVTLLAQLSLGGAKVPGSSLYSGGGPKAGVRGHPSIPLLPLSLTMSICIPHSLYTYLTTPRPLRPPRGNRHSSSISRYSTIRPT